MLTFEKVLEVFADYLEQDTEYEVVLTKHGYTVMWFNEVGKEWYDAQYCETPEDMRDELLDAYKNYLEYTTTRSRRAEKEDVTEQEAAEIQAKLDELEEKCKA